MLAYPQNYTYNENHAKYYITAQLPTLHDIAESRADFYVLT